MRGVLRRMADDLGVAGLVDTQDLGVVRHIADRVAVMYLGRIVESGTVEEVLTAPRHPYTRALVSVLPESVPAPSGVSAPTILTGEPPDPTRIPGGCRFHVRCPVLASGEAERAGVADACRTQDLPVLKGEPGTQVACHWAAAARE
jgi:oligopeptide/dipeptide ABC transporter ATP-binding protein